MTSVEFMSGKESRDFITAEIKKQISYLEQSINELKVKMIDLELIQKNMKGGLYGKTNNRR